MSVEDGIDGTEAEIRSFASRLVPRDLEGVPDAPSVCGRCGRFVHPGKACESKNNSREEPEGKPGLPRVKEADYSPAPGEHVSRTAANICAVANVIKTSVDAVFNGFFLRARPGMKPEDLVAAYEEARGNRDLYCFIGEEQADPAPVRPVRLGKKLAGHDPVDHPAHYTAHPSGIEAIQVTEYMNFCLGNAVKYLWRAGSKGSEVEDLKKARWYLDREIARLEKK